MNHIASKLCAIGAVILAIFVLRTTMVFNVNKPE